MKELEALRNELSEIKKLILETRDDTEVMTLDEVAQKLKRSRDCIYKWEKKGIIPRHFNIGGASYFKKSDIDRVIIEMSSAT